MDNLKDEYSIRDIIGQFTVLRNSTTSTEKNNNKKRRKRKVVPWSKNDTTEIWIGRHENCDLRIKNDQTISRFQAHLKFCEEREIGRSVTIRDQGQINHIKLNGEELPNDGIPRVLGNGDILVVGSTVETFIKFEYNYDYTREATDQNNVLTANDSALIDGEKIEEATSKNSSASNQRLSTGFFDFEGDDDNEEQLVTNTNIPAMSVMNKSNSSSGDNPRSKSSKASSNNYGLVHNDDDEMDSEEQLVTNMNLSFANNVVENKRHATEDEQKGCLKPSQNYYKQNEQDNKRKNYRKSSLPELCGLIGDVDDEEEELVTPREAESGTAHEKRNKGLNNVRSNENKKVHYQTKLSTEKSNAIIGVSSSELYHAMHYDDDDDDEEEELVTNMNLADVMVIASKNSNKRMTHNDRLDDQKSQYGLKTANKKKNENVKNIAPSELYGLVDDENDEDEEDLVTNTNISHVLAKNKRKLDKLDPHQSNPYLKHQVEGVKSFDNERNIRLESLLDQNFSLDNNGMQAKQVHNQRFNHILPPPPPPPHHHRAMEDNKENVPYRNDVAVHSLSTSKSQPINIFSTSFDQQQNQKNTNNNNNRGVSSFKSRLLAMRKERGRIMSSSTNLPSSSNTTNSMNGII